MGLLEAYMALGGAAGRHQQLQRARAAAIAGAYIRDHIDRLQPLLADVSEHFLDGDLVSTVVLQGHSQEYLSASLLDDVRHAKAVANAASAALVWYMTPEYGRDHYSAPTGHAMIQGIETAFTEVGSALAVPVLPVGLAFRAVYDTCDSCAETLPLHDVDGSHPSGAGSYLAAAVAAFSLQCGLSVETLQAAGSMWNLAAGDREAKRAVMSGAAEFLPRANRTFLLTIARAVSEEWFAREGSVAAKQCGASGDA